MANKGGRRRKIVVVEDDPEILDLEMFLLTSEGFDVVPVASGLDAYEVIKREAADLVVLDLMLPGKDGNAVLDELEADPETANVPVIVVSAFTDKLTNASQIRRVIPKPFDVMELLDGISQELAAG